eukprot:1141114_1
MAATRDGEVFTWASPISGPMTGRLGNATTPLPLNLSGNTLPITSMVANYLYGVVLVDGRDSYAWGYGEPCELAVIPSESGEPLPPALKMDGNAGGLYLLSRQGELWELHILPRINCPGYNMSEKGTFERIFIEDQG